MPFHGFGAGKPTTGFPHAASTPIGNPRFPGVAGTPRFLASRQVHNSPFNWDSGGSYGYFDASTIWLTGNYFK